MLAYYLVLRSILKSKPHLRRCLTRCRHCRVFFVCDPRNAGRKDLGCGFGCTDAHRKRRSTERSVAYYQDPPGKIKKAIQNARRCKPAPTPDPPADPAPIPETVLEHVQTVVGLIEGRFVSRQEILGMLLRVLRQHSMVRRRRIDQAIDWLKANPP